MSKRKASTTSMPFRPTKMVMVKPLRQPARPPAKSGKVTYGLSQGNHGPELKVIDTDLSAITGFDTTGSVTLLNGIAQGTDYNTRIGRKFTMKTLYVRMSLQPGATAANIALARFIVVYDRQANGQAPAITDVLTAVNDSSLNNLTNRDRFVIITDKVYKVGLSTSMESGRQIFKKYLKCNLEVTNGGTGATIASIQTGSLYLLTMGDKVAGTTAPKVLNGTYRIRFTDD